MLSPRETEKLVIYQIAELARRRKQRGLRLNFPESIALITEALLEAARDGKSVADVIELGRTLDHFSVPAREKEEVLAAFNGWKEEVTAGSQPDAINWRRWR